MTAETEARSGADGNGPRPLLSVVFTAYTPERKADVQELLTSLQQQSYPNVEMIFVAEGPAELAEGIDAFARERGIENLRVVINDGEKGLSPARNLGVKHARGESLYAYTLCHTRTAGSKVSVRPVLSRRSIENSASSKGPAFQASNPPLVFPASCEKWQ